MTHLSPARRCSPSLRSAAQSRVVQTYRPDPVRLGRVALRRNRWRTTMQLGNGTTRAYAYDANSRLTTQIELNGATRLVTIVDSYDPVGNRIGRNLDGVLTTWTYDDLYRLTHQDKPGQVCTYVLDPVGNLEVMWEGGANPKSFTFDAADRLVTMALGANLTTFTYTTYGALEVEVTGSQRTTYTYDGQDQLVGVLPHSGVLSTYTFDGDGMRRTAQEGNVQPTTMVWDGSDYLFLDGPSSDSLVLTLDGEIVACGSKDLLTDPLGTLLREISTGATLSSAFGFYPYGSPVLPAFSTPTIPFRYIAAYGYYFDTNDRDYVRARELEKRLGRWMQMDPLWPDESAFGYVRAMLLTRIDPTGRKSSKYPGCSPEQEKQIDRHLQDSGGFCRRVDTGLDPSCLDSCLATCRPKFDPGPAHDYKICLRAFCKNPDNIICASSDSGGKCAESSSRADDCKIILYPRFWKKPCPGASDHKGDWMYFFLHESAHCCSQGVTTGAYEVNADNIALCILFRCFGGKVSFNETLYGVPVPKDRIGGMNR